MASNIAVNPKNMAEPLGAYSHGILNEGPGRWLHISGQIGIHPDGALAKDAFEQIDAIWKNITTLLHEVGMDASHISKIVTYVTDPTVLKHLGQIRENYLGNHRPASTVLVVQALAHHEWLVEIDALAFRADEPNHSSSHD